MITREHYNELDKLMKAAVEHGDGILSEFEDGFITEWVDRLETYGESVRVSEKQQMVFDKIQSKLEREGLL